MNVWKIGWTGVLLLAMGCVGTEVGNPQDTKESEVTFEFAAVTPAANALTLANGVEVDRALFAVEELGLRPASTCDGSDRIDLETPFSVDVVTGDLQPELDPVLRPAITYCRLDIELMSSSEAASGLPAELTDRAIFIEGSLEDGTPFEVSIREDDEIRIDGDFALQPGEDSLIVGFDLTLWFELEVLAALEPEADGVIRIDSANGDVDEVSDDIRERIVTSVTLYRDTNDNGMLDPGVDTVVGVAGEDNEEEEEQ